MTQRNRPAEAGRLICFALTVLIGLFAVVRVYATITRPDWQGLLANDLIHYELAVDRWLSTGSPYPPSEVAGPFEYGPETFLHPPISLPFFLAWKVIPWPLFWIIPLMIFGYVVVSFRPKPWAWPLLVLPLAIYPIGAPLISGNTDLWAWAMFAAGIRWGWPAAFVALKPSLVLFSFVGAWHRKWWTTAGILCLAAMPFEGLWIEWIKVVLNSPGSLLYSVGNVVMFSIPVVARLSADRQVDLLDVRVRQARGRLRPVHDEHPAIEQLHG